MHIYSRYKSTMPARSKLLARSIIKKILLRGELTSDLFAPLKVTFNVVSHSSSKLRNTRYTICQPRVIVFGSEISRTSDMRDYILEANLFSTLPSKPYGEQYNSPD